MNIMFQVFVAIDPLYELTYLCTNIDVTTLSFYFPNNTSEIQTRGLESIDAAYTPTKYYKIF